jgi:hypothetical protein
MINFFKKNKILSTSIILWFIANILDFGSTIIQSPQAEENPFVSFMWTHYGDLGLILVTLFSWFIVQWIVVVFCERSKAIPITLILLSVFKILIGLTNLALVPLWVTGWFTY